MWLSLALLLTSGVAHFYDHIEDDDLYGKVVVALLLALVAASCLAMINNVQQFRHFYSETTSSTPALRWWPKVGHVDVSPQGYDLY